MRMQVQFSGQRSAGNGMLSGSPAAQCSSRVLLSTPLTYCSCCTATSYTEGEYTIRLRQQHVNGRHHWYVPASRAIGHWLWAAEHTGAPLIRVAEPWRCSVPEAAAARMVSTWSSFVTFTIFAQWDSCSCCLQFRVRAVHPDRQKW